MDVVDESRATAVLAPPPATLGSPASEHPVAPPHAGIFAGWLKDTSWPPASWALVATALLVAVGVVLRFWTRSDMWLDEALTVDISRLPLSQIHAALMRDGAPPLYYVLLHFWMKIFGHSDLGARSLSGVISVATLPCVWIAGNRLGGKAVACAVTVLVATSPFAIYYGTEARMYSLVAFLTTVGFLALESALRRPTKANLAGTVICTALLLYTHYWALYLVAVIGAWLVFQSWRGPHARRKGARTALVAVVGGCVLFLPWVPTFLYQSRHTGTPWAIPANFAALVNAVSSFAGGPTNEGRALALLYFALAGLGLFGLASDRFHITLDIRGRPSARGLGIVVVGTLALGDRLRLPTEERVLAALRVRDLRPPPHARGHGTRDLHGPSDRERHPRCRRRLRARDQLPEHRHGALPGLPGGPGTGPGGKARRHRRVLPRPARPGLPRLLPAGRYDEITFPRGNGPQFVDWVDYATVVGRASPQAFAHRLEQMSEPDHRIWFVWAPGYQTFGGDCQIIESTLLADTKLGGNTVFSFGPFYEPSQLVEFAYRRG